MEIKIIGILLLSIFAIHIFVIVFYVESIKRVQFPNTREIFKVGSTISKRQGAKPECNFDFLKEYFLKYKQYYNKGEWVNDTWYPKYCSVKLTSDIQQCFKEKKIRKIVLLGDSTGKLYAQALLRSLGQYAECEDLKIDFSPFSVQTPDKRYFSCELEDVIVHDRDCKGCSPFLSICNFTKAGPHITAVTIEYLTMEYYMDTEVTTFRNKWTNTCKDNLPQYSSWGVPCGSSFTTQELIFHEYLPIKKLYPELIIIIGSFHEMARKNAEGFKRSLSWFMDLVNESTLSHPESQTIWLEPTFIDSSKQPEYYRNRTSQFQHFKLYEMSKNILAPYFAMGSRRFIPFYGIMDISKDKCSDWNRDGVHYNRSFYTAITDLLLNTLC